MLEYSQHLSHLLYSVILITKKLYLNAIIILPVREGVFTNGSGFKQLLILMVVAWSMAVMLRRIGLPTIRGEPSWG